MKNLASLLLRVLVLTICGIASWMSIRHARADIATGPGTTAAFTRALQIEPDNLELIVSDALLKNYSGDFSPAVDEQLLRASRLNPMNSAVLIALGLRAEFRSDNASAERYLARASEVDHSFKPAWTFASFCYRTGVPEKFWPMAQRCLNLDPLNLDPRPVFDLAWHLVDDTKNGDAEKIRSILPRSGPRLVDYLTYLMDTKRTDAAAAIWPEALNSFDPANPGIVSAIVRFSDYMAGVDRVPEAVHAWNQLVDRKIVHSGRLDPATGKSIADPDFRFLEPSTGLFAWQATRDEGIFVLGGASAIRFELDGNEPQASLLLATTAAVLPEKAYRLRWKYDASQLVAPKDPGFEIRVVQQPANLTTICRPFLDGGEAGVCTFTSAPGVQRAGIELRYARASGTTRAKGTLMLSDIHLEFAS
jgi:tetratricopeptide (TPR) repeat protein